MSKFSILFAILLTYSQVQAGPLDNPVDDIDTPEAQVSHDCPDFNTTCSGCTSLGHCKFLHFQESPITLCVEKTMAEEEMEKLVPGKSLDDIEILEDSCDDHETHEDDENENNTIPPKFSTSLTPEKKTTTTTASTTSSGSSTTTTASSTVTSTTTMTSTTTTSTRYID